MNTDIIKAQTSTIWLEEECICKRVLVTICQLSVIWRSTCVSPKKHWPCNLPKEHISLDTSLNQAGGLAYLFVLIDLYVYMTPSSIWPNALSEITQSGQFLKHHHLTMISIFWLLKTASHLLGNWCWHCCTNSRKKS